MFLWDVGKSMVLVEVELPDLCLSMSFNYDGTQFVTTCKDKKMRIFETRTGKLLTVCIQIYYNKCVSHIVKNSLTLKFVSSLYYLLYMYL